METEALPDMSADKSVDVSALGRKTLESAQEHQQEMLLLVARLCQLIPAGASMLFNIDFADKPQLVTSNGQPVGKIYELIQINRPIAYVQQEAKLNRPVS